jgi:hypothetical protein
LEGASNFNPWKRRMALLLEVNEAWEITRTNVASPTNATLLAAHKKKDVNAKRLILDGVKDPSSHTCPGRTQQERCGRFSRSTAMSKADTVTSYLTKISQVCDDLAAIGETISNANLVRTTLNGFSEKWDTFVKGVASKENLPN